MSDEAEDFLIKQLTNTVCRLTDSVKEMLAASRLLRSRIENNDAVLLRLENKQTMLEERVRNMEKEVELLHRNSHIHPAQDHWKK